MTKSSKMRRVCSNADLDHGFLVLRSGVDIVAEGQPFLHPPGSDVERHGANGDQRHRPDARSEELPEWARIVDLDRGALAHGRSRRGANAASRDGGDERRNAQVADQDAIDQANAKTCGHAGEPCRQPSVAMHEQRRRRHVAERGDLHEADIDFSGCDNPGQSEDHQRHEAGAAQDRRDIAEFEHFRTKRNEPGDQRRQGDKQPVASDAQEKIGRLDRRQFYTFGCAHEAALFACGGLIEKLVEMGNKPSDPLVKSNDRDQQYRADNAVAVVEGHAKEREAVDQDGDRHRSRQGRRDGGPP